ncbi:hypothetical protein MRB53_028863 [Persea americana]|uniref:Uncharacterized protein n=1 Tax=Persea americana TaxID=3435 RepID=A0ACC2KGT6_PERAE|nr:hypothetical protein MRB53_028863 [Persea americana]
MEIGHAGNERIEFWARCLQRVDDLVAQLVENVARVPKKVKKIGKDDPRRIFHSLKVGLALTLVSMFYYLRPLYDGFGVNAMWAVLTVVVVFEYTVGATFSKGLNRIFATMLAGALAVGARQLASFSGERGEPIILGVFVFLIAAASTFARFFPGIKARYDYGVVIFILTFSLVAVSGYRVDELIKLAHQRLSTIILGSCTCLFISVCVYPVWAGEDLQKLIANNLEKLAMFLEVHSHLILEKITGFGEEYLKKEEGESADVAKKDSSFLEAYKSILNSKTSEDSLANFARWEPGHGRFRFRHPWHQYLRIGALARQCACSINALNACTSSKTQIPMEFRQRIQEACRKMSLETGKALANLSLAVRTIEKPTAAAIHILGAKIAAADIKTALKTTSSEMIALLEILPMATTASLLIEIVGHTEKLMVAINELAHLVKFNNPASVAERIPSLHRRAVKPLSNDVVIGIPRLESSSLENVETAQAKSWKSRGEEGKGEEERNRARYEGPRTAESLTEFVNT